MKYLAAKGRLSILSDLKAIEVFISIAETCSLTRTAERLAIAPSTVSKKITELEERAKVRLLSRNTRKVVITENGQEFYKHCLKLMDDAENAEQALTKGRDSPMGRIRITAPVALGERKITPLIPSFLKRYPGVEVEVETSTRTMKLLDEGYDLSIRLTSAVDISTNDTILGSNEKLFCASPGYLAMHGTPKHPEDLTAHSCLTVRLPGSCDVWQYTDGRRTRRISVSGPLSSNNANMLAEAACEDVGIVLLGSFIVSDYIRDGRLVNILPGFQPRDTVIAAIVSDHAMASRHVRAFVSYLKDAWPREDRQSATPLLEHLNVGIEHDNARLAGVA